jgi:hypothetical protein
MEKSIRPPDSRKQDGMNRLKNEIQKQGKQTGERFDNDLFQSPKWRPYSPELWQGGQFVVSTKVKNL